MTTFSIFQYEIKSHPIQCRSFSYQEQPLNRFFSYLLSADQSLVHSLILKDVFLMDQESFWY